ncbi:MAG: TolC family protein [Bacteroidales bacterium]|jgi:outer membrane protein TolC|nr:TolC family protein [Bacteroidales bacterium]
MNLFRITFVLLLCGAGNTAFAQLTIVECQRKARENYPLITRYMLIDKLKAYSLDNAGKGYLPQVSVSAKAAYQSEVTEIPLQLPGIELPHISKDQYAATIDVNQTIWDGGLIHAKKELIKTGATIEQSQLEVDLYAIKERVNQIFFGILSLDAKLAQTELLLAELQRNYERVDGYRQNGLANLADLDVVRVEQLNVRQTQIRLASSRKAFLEMLSLLTGKSISERDILQHPEDEEEGGMDTFNRPELQLFNAQLSGLDAQKLAIKAGAMPRVGLFITGGYGRPGLNMLKDEFSGYYVGGIRISWNFSSLYTKKNDIRSIEINRENINALRETFLFNTRLQVSRENSEITKNRELLRTDDEIIALRNRLKQATEAKVANGTATVTDLMRDITAEDLARQDKIQHELEWLLAVYNRKFITNEYEQ